MGFPPNATVYTFSGVDFVRILDGDSFQPWAFAELTYSADSVLGGTVKYLDIGSSVAPAFSFRAALNSASDRFTLRGLLGTTGTLSNTRGRSDTMTLVKATPIDGQANQFWADLTFELRPT